METIVFSSKRNLHELNHMLTGKISLCQKDAISYLGVEPEKIKEASFFLAEWLHCIYTKAAIRNGLRTSFDFLSQDEINGVKQIVNQRLEEEKDHYIHIIQESLINFTEISSAINLEGVWLFAMQDYRDEILGLMEDSLDEYLAEQDYREFLDLLHHFVELETSQIRKLLVVTLPNGVYQFYNESYQDITEQCLRTMLDEFPCREQEEAETQNDLLISLLVILLPEEIYLYGTKFIENKNFLATLKIIFSNRIQFFEECF